jgi:ribonucrease Y
VLVVTGILIGALVGAALALAVLTFRSSTRLGAARRLRQQLVADAKREADALRREAQIEAREQSVRLRAEIEEELQARRATIARTEAQMARAGDRGPRAALEATA